MMTSVRWVKVSLPNLLNKICFQKKMREEVNTAGHKAKPHFNISNCTVSPIGCYTCTDAQIENKTAYQP